MHTAAKNRIGVVVLIVFALLVASEAYTELQASSAVQLSELSISSTTGDRVYKGRPFTGIAVHYFPDGQKAGQEGFSNGRRDGQLRKWFENGELAFESSYQSGRREGVTRSWWSNGSLRSQTTYVDDRPDGVAWRWYRSGEKFKRYNYAAGNPVGLQQGWRTNGKLFSNFEYRNGRTYGLRNSNLCVELDDEAFISGS